jgi:CHAT domain-containing protein
LSFVSDPTFPSRDDHLRRLEVPGEIDVSKVETLSELQRVWTSRPEGFDLVHFFTHHVLDPGTGAPALLLGDEYLTEVHLSGLNLKWSHHPLVILAGCSSGVAHSLSAPSSLISAFRICGASGVVGTECTVRDNVADGLMGAFLEDLFAGEPIGPALLAMRQRTLRQGNSPAGLAYSLFALSGLRFLDATGDEG